MGTLALFKPAAAVRIDRNPVEVYLAGLSATGRRSMAQKLRIVAPVLGAPDPRNVPWEKLKFEYLVAIRTWLVASDRSPSTINATLAALRGTAKAAWSLGLLSSHAYSRIAAVKRAASFEASEWSGLVGRRSGRSVSCLL
jgi:hypothetical protein